MFQAPHTAGCNIEIVKVGADCNYSSPFSNRNNIEQSNFIDIVLFIYCLFSVTALKCLTMKARAAAVYIPQFCAWQPNIEVGQATE